MYHSGNYNPKFKIPDTKLKNQWSLDTDIFNQRHRIHSMSLKIHVCKTDEYCMLLLKWWWCCLFNPFQCVREKAKPLMKKPYFNWIKTCCFAGYLQYLLDFREQLLMIRWLYSFLKMISITNRFCNLVELLTLPRKLFNKRDMTILYLLDIWETLNIQKLLL